MLRPLLALALLRLAPLAPPQTCRARLTGPLLTQAPGGRGRELSSAAIGAVAAPGPGRTVRTAEHRAGQRAQALAAIHRAMRHEHQVSLVIGVSDQHRAQALARVNGPGQLALAALQGHGLAGPGRHRLGPQRARPGRGRQALLERAGVGPGSEPHAQGMTVLRGGPATIVPALRCPERAHDLSLRSAESSLSVR